MARVRVLRVRGLGRPVGRVARPPSSCLQRFADRLVELDQGARPDQRRRHAGRAGSLVAGRWRHPRRGPGSASEHSGFAGHSDHSHHLRGSGAHSPRRCWCAARVRLGVRSHVGVEGTSARGKPFRPRSDGQRHHAVRRGREPPAPSLAAYDSWFASQPRRCAIGQREPATCGDDTFAAGDGLCRGMVRPGAGRLVRPGSGRRPPTRRLAGTSLPAPRRRRCVAHQ